MKIVDANVLINAVNTESSLRDRAVSWLDSSLVGNTRIGFELLSS